MLTGRQQEFCRRYVIHFNASLAARESGYKEDSDVAGPRLMGKDSIKAEVKRLLNEKIMREEEIEARLGDIARGDIVDLMELTSSGFAIALSKVNEQGERVRRPQTKLIKKVRQKVTTIQGKRGEEDKEIIETEIELYPADEALKFLAKVHGMVTDKQDITTKVDAIQFIRLGVDPDKI